MASDYESINQIKVANSISKRIEVSLTSQSSYWNPIDLANTVLKNQK